MAAAPRARICDLPNEMLLSIFSFLPVADLARCAATCERWRAIVTGCTHLWEGKHFRSHWSPTACAQTLAVLQALPPIREVTIELAGEFMLHVSYPHVAVSVTRGRDAKDFPRLRCECLSTRLDIAGDILSHRLAVDFGGLRHLQIGPPDVGVPLSYSAEYVVRTALSLCPNLSHLSICVGSLSAEGIDTAEGLARLQTLEVACPGLEKLSFLRHCSGSLVELELVDCVGLPSRELAQLRQLGNLRKLRLGSCFFEQGDLAAAAAGLRNLEVLKLVACSWVRDLSPLRHCPQLREVCVADSPLLGPLVEVIQASRQPQLHDLRLPTDVQLRSQHAVAVALTADHLSAALSTLEELALPESCLAYLGALRHCSLLRHFCCEFVHGDAENEGLRTFVHITLTSNA